MHKRFDKSGVSMCLWGYISTNKAPSRQAETAVFRPKIILGGKLSAFQEIANATGTEVLASDDADASRECVSWPSKRPCEPESTRDNNDF